MEGKGLLVTAAAESCINLRVSGEKSDTLNSVSEPCQKNSKLKSGQLSSGLLLNCSLDGGDIIFFSIGASHQVPKQSDQLYSKCVLIHLGPSRLRPPSYSTQGRSRRHAGPRAPGPARDVFIRETQTRPEEDPRGRRASAQASALQKRLMRPRVSIRFAPRLCHGTSLYIELSV